MTNEPADQPAVGDPIRAKWLMDGSTTLAEAAERLERQAALLRSLHAEGWTLTAPIEDDYGFLRDPSGNVGHTDDSEDLTADEDDASLN